jgi:hypothetical protein
VLSEAYGVFVAPAPSDAGLDGAATTDTEAGTDDGIGTMQQPFRTVGRALAQRGARTRIYVCNGTYAEPVAITSPVEIFGGLSCPTVDGGLAWSYVGGSAHVSAPPSAYALTVTGVGPAADSGLTGDGGDAGPSAPVHIEDVAFTAPDATEPGASSIAAFITASSVQLVRVALSAGRGADGQAGDDGAFRPNYDAGAPSGGAQVVGSNGFGIAAGAGGINLCNVFGNSAGGDGGEGCSLDAGFATPGIANPAAPVTIPGRDGLPRGAALPDGGVVSSDDPGADGVASTGGSAADGYGVLSASGWAPSAGGNGQPGGPGQGGAGGSDPLANTNCSAPLASIGGGGGGAGGCGGEGGMGGQGGGASIALASLASVVDMQSCPLSTGAGGTGGAGGGGQDGQPGASGGDDLSSSLAHARGAAGGNGAGGSGGAGGTGGLSGAILQQTSLVTPDASTLQNVRMGPPGAGGAAGPAGRRSTSGPLQTGFDGSPGGSGSPGASAAVLSLM